MAKRTYTYDGSSWVGLASPAVSLSNYPNMTNTPISGFRNALINGGMDVWQRGTSGIVPTSTQQYTADRWESYRAGYAAGMSVYRPAGPTGITYAARVQRDVGNTSTASMAFGQAIESVNSTRFDGKNVTLSFWARAGANFSSASSVLTAQVNYGTGTDQNYRNGFTGNTVVVSSGVTLTTSWQRFTITGNVNVVATQVGVQFSYTPIGTAGAADHFEITGVQLEEGSIATPFEQRPVGTEISLCQRYFQKSFSITTAPVTPAGTGDGSGNNLTIFAPTVGNAYSSLTRFQTTMRRNPDITLYNAETSAIGTWSIYSSSAQLNNSYAVAGGSYHNGIMFNVIGVPTVTVANGAWTANAEL